MPISHVIIDTNIIVKDARLSGRDLLKLVKTRKLYDFEICLPMIVYDELIGNFDKDFKSKLSQLKKTIDDINKLVSVQSEINKQAITRKFSKSLTRYKSRLDKFIRDNKVILLPYPNISHQTIVKRMYDGATPFGNEKCTEKGYKDFLILQSILEYFSPLKSSTEAILLTANLKDFTGSTENDKSGIVGLDRSLDMEFISIAPSPAVLFQKLSENLKNKHKSDNIFSSSSDISRKIEGAVMSDFSMFDSDILGSFFLNVKIENLSCDVKDFAVVEDEDIGTLEVSGIVKIEMNCDFHMDEWDFLNLLEPEFVFSNDVNRFVEKQGFSKRDEWENEFQGMKTSSEFIFNYIDFDFKHGTQSDNIKFDPIFLSLSRI